MSELFEGKSFAETLDQIEKYRKEGLEEIRQGSPSNLADIADAFDYWMPWMLEQLRAVPAQELMEKRLREALELSRSKNCSSCHWAYQFGRKEAIKTESGIWIHGNEKEHRFNICDAKNEVNEALALSKIQVDKEPQEKSQGLCDTTQTERFSNPDCRCKTYEGNLGPCRTFDTAGNGRCAYCDHELSCHTAEAGKGRG